MSNINDVFFSLSLPGLLFSQKGLSKGSEIFHVVLKIWGEQNQGDLPLDLGVIFLVFFKKFFNSIFLFVLLKECYPSLPQDGISVPLPHNKIVTNTLTSVFGKC